MQKAPYRALLIGGALLFAAYSLIWALLLRDPQLIALHAQAGAGASGDPMIYYQVITASGALRVLPVERNDPASVLTEAEKRFGAIKSVKRVNREAAERLQSRQASTRLRRWFGALLLLPVAVLVAGLWLRSRELRFERFWKVLRPTLSADAAKLGAQTGLSGGALRVAMIEANRRGLAQLDWDVECNRIADTRLSLYNITVEFCERCNEPLGQRVLADLKRIPRCPACMSDHDTAFLDEIKRPIVEQLHEKSAEARRRDPARRPFSAGVFGLLLLLFPPAAVAYAVRR